MKRFKAKPVFWTLVGAFIMSAGTIAGLPLLFQGETESLLFPILLLISGILLFLLGVVLLVLTKKGETKGTFRKFQLLTGASAVGIPVGAVLHNVFYALEMSTSHIAILSQSMGILHTVFFLIAIPICPIGFLVGAIGSIILAKRAYGS